MYDRPGQTAFGASSHNGFAGAGNELKPDKWQSRFKRTHHTVMHGIREAHTPNDILA